MLRNGGTMNRKLLFRRVDAFLVAIVLIWVAIMCPVSGKAEESSNYNRFNVVVALDASSSMDYTDPNHLRYNAISQFVNLLAEKGNLLGGVVFSDQIAGQQEPIAADSQASKNQVIEMLENATTTLENTPTPDGLRYTNIGEALDVAVSMLEEYGNPDLPSVILLLSDGNTEMPTEEELELSLEQKAEAIQTARDRGIQIYNVCLNANGRADFSEMEQISNATGGEAREVTIPEDLQDVFNAFYNLIYGTSTITLVDDKFPDSGKLEKEFEVPGLGVEEVNIIIYGMIDEIELIKPDGTKAEPEVQRLDTFTMIKLVDLVPGTWKLVTKGVPENSIKINMVFNTNLEIEVTADSVQADTNTPWKVEAALKTGDKLATDVKQYKGYEAELQIFDAYQEPVETIPMKLSDETDAFLAEYTFSEGSYFYAVHVKGNYIERTTEKYGPLTVTIPVETEENEEIQESVVSPVNQPPEAVLDRVEKSVYIWPIKGGKFVLDLKTLAEDEEDDTLHYRIVSSSFIEGTDYNVDANDILVQQHFSLKKGSYTVRATDSGGLFCEVEVVVKTHNVTIMMLIGILVCALIAAIVLGILLYIALTRPFLGPIYVTEELGGQRKTPIKVEKQRGRVNLRIFGLASSDLNYKKSYLQATGKPYIILVTNKPVYFVGKPVTKLDIRSGNETKVELNQEGTHNIYIRFECRLRKR